MPPAGVADKYCSTQDGTVICPALTGAAHKKPAATPFTAVPPWKVTCVPGIPPVQVTVRSLERSIGVVIVVTVGLLVHTNGAGGTSNDVEKAPASFPPVPATV